jgi:ubiquinone/menaquinone biosynthesis C-methylase UbiE
MTIETRFVGSIPELYDRHLGPVLFEPYARELGTRMPPHARRVLELAAGTGRVTRQLLAVLAPDGELIATDLNQPMIDEAKRRTPDDPRLRWQVADAMALPVPDHSIDAVVCGFGLMFVPDKAQALREIKRVLAPGGILLATVWDEMAKNGYTVCLHQHAVAAFPDDPPVFMLTPFSMHDRHELERLATEAGLRGIRVDTVAKTGDAESAEHLAIGLVRGNPLWNQLSERGVDAAAFETKLIAEVVRRFGDRPCKGPLSAHVLTAFA